MSTQLSVVIVNWNTRELLRECVAALFAALECLGRQTSEVIVVDNGSSDGSAEMVRAQFPDVKLIENTENYGFAHANNQAIATSSGKYILLLNSDAMVKPDTLEKLVAFAENSGDVGIVAPILLNRDGTFQAAGSRLPSLSKHILQLLGLARRVYGPHFPSVGPEDCREVNDVEWVGGACMLVRRHAMDSVGSLDEGFFMYAEDVDWCYRMRQARWRICVLREAETYHYGGRSSEIVQAVVLARQWKALLYYHRKHHGLAYYWAVRLVLAVFACLRLAIFAAASILPGGRRQRFSSMARMNLNLVMLRTSENG